MPSAPLPVPTPVPEFLAPRINSVRDAVRTGQPAHALDRARLISTELAGSYGPLHPYALHALELVSYCAQLAGQPVGVGELHQVPFVVEPGARLRPEGRLADRQEV